MLVLKRREGERIKIGDHIVVTVVQGSCKLGIDAPAGVPIVRAELAEKCKAGHSQDYYRRALEALADQAEPEADERGT